MTAQAHTDNRITQFRQLFSEGAKLRWRREEPVGKNHAQRFGLLRLQEVRLAASDGRLLVVDIAVTVGGESALALPIALHLVIEYKARKSIARDARRLLPGALHRLANLRQRCHLVGIDLDRVFHPDFVEAVSLRELGIEVVAPGFFTDEIGLGRGKQKSLKILALPAQHALICLRVGKTGVQVNRLFALHELDREIKRLVEALPPDLVVPLRREMQD